MEISFRDAQLCRTFNTYVLLERQFGVELAQCISVRMAALSAAPSLANIPSRPPLNLKRSSGSYTVGLVGTRYLRFRPDGKKGGQLAPDKPHLIKSIEIIGVER